MLAIWAVAVVALAGRALWRGVARPGADTSVVSCTIDVNRASVAELQALPGVGPSRAEAIVLERVRHGPYRAIDDLARVHGFGSETLRRLAPYVRF
ncbi:MAG: ComEA family DNA-binding protein [Planctomycetes bacterium]|nr:ComEA family DNA-binding protein [Planctomycetota bacterium]